jgi:Tol biopolymer transport system component
VKVEPGGTGMQTILDLAPGPRHAAWGARDVIVFSNNVLGPLLSVPAAGGTATPVTSVPADVTGEAHRFPQFLQDGKRFLYVASWTNQQRGGVYLASLDGGTPELVSSEIRGRMVLANDHLLFMRGGTLMAQTFDSTSGRLTGVPRAILRNDVVLDWRFGDLPLTASQNGMLVFQSRRDYNTQLVSYDRGGREQGIVGSPGFAAPALSPDGRRVAVALDQAGSGQQNLWIHDLQRSISTQLTTTGTDTAHTWSPDGRWILFSSIRSQNGIYRKLADGSGTEETIMESPAHLLVNAYAPDGRSMLYMHFRSGRAEVSRYDFETKKDVPMEGSAEASYSPDGKWIAALGMPSWGLTVRPTTGNGRVQVSDGPGGQPRWRGDGKEIFYIARDKRLMAVELATKNGTLEAGPPKPLFQTRIVRPSFVLFQYDVSADGQRFLINSLPREDAAAPLTLLSNWTAFSDR